MKEEFKHQKLIIINQEKFNAEFRENLMSEKSSKLEAYAFIDVDFSEIKNCEFENCLFVSCKFENQPIRNVVVNGCVFSSCLIDGCYVTNIQLFDVIFDNCNVKKIPLLNNSSMENVEVIKECILKRK